MNGYFTFQGQLTINENSVVISYSRAARLVGTAIDPRLMWFAWISCFRSRPLQIVPPNFGREHKVKLPKHGHKAPLSHRFCDLGYIKTCVDTGSYHLDSGILVPL